MNPVLVVGGQLVSGAPAGRHCWVWCPGCDELHAPEIVGEKGDLPPGPCWDWDGNLEAPTFSPSLLVFGSVRADASSGQRGNCHSFIRGGQWEFLADSAHHLAGQTVPMVPLPDWLVGR